MCPHIEDLKSKCVKCGLPQKTKNYGLNVGNALVWDIQRIDARSKERM